MDFIWQVYFNWLAFGRISIKASKTRIIVFDCSIITLKYARAVKLILIYFNKILTYERICCGYCVCVFRVEYPFWRWQIFNKEKINIEMMTRDHHMLHANHLSHSKIFEQSARKFLSISGHLGVNISIKCSKCIDFFVRYLQCRDLMRQMTWQKWKGKKQILWWTFNTGQKDRTSTDRTMGSFFQLIA